MLASLLLLMTTTVGVSGAGESIEHVQLDSAPKSVVIDSLAGRIGLVGVPDSVVIKAASRSTLCPKTERRAEGARLELLCKSRRLVVELEGKTLRLRMTRAAPITADASRAPKTFYDPGVYNLGGACPGDTPSSRGECALQQGQYVEAALALREAWTTQNDRHAHAALRLGDLAWQAGDLESAAGWYDKAGAGPFARVAAARLCELTAGCLDGPMDRLHFNAWDTGALPTQLADEIVLRRARALAFADRLDDSVRFLLSVTTSKHAPCAAAPALCRSIATEALRARAGKDAPTAMALALSLPTPFEGEGALDLARAVVVHTDRLGAPVYGASVLAAVTALVPKPELGDHLARTAEHYLAADDTVRADIVIGFARSRGHATNKRWQAIAAKRRAIEAMTTTTTTTTKAPAKAKAKMTKVATAADHAAHHGSTP